MIRLTILLLSLIFVGCQPSTKSESASEASAAERESMSVVTPISQDGEVLVVRMTANDQMRYNLDQFTVKPGQTVRLTLDNIGKMPKASMGHNVVIVQPDTNLNALAAAAALEKANDYIPPSFKDSIFAHTIMLGAGESDTIEFTAPEATGVYPFLCSFPAHLFAGMRGEMVVEAETAE